MEIGEQNGESSLSTLTRTAGVTHLKKRIEKSRAQARGPVRVVQKLIQSAKTKPPGTVNITELFYKEAELRRRMMER